MASVIACGHVHAHNHDKGDVDGVGCLENLNNEQQIVANSE